jgi:hypothetical protein
MPREQAASQTAPAGLPAMRPTVWLTLAVQGGPFLAADRASICREARQRITIDGGPDLRRSAWRSPFLVMTRPSARRALYRRWPPPGPKVRHEQASPGMCLPAAQPHDGVGLLGRALNLLAQTVRVEDLSGSGGARY